MLEQVGHHHDNKVNNKVNSKGNKVEGDCLDWEVAWVCKGPSKQVPQWGQVQLGLWQPFLHLVYQLVCLGSQEGV